LRKKGFIMKTKKIKSNKMSEACGWIGMILIHGEDVAKSREELNRLISEAKKQDLMGRAGTLSNMAVRITVNTDATFAVRMRVDGSNGNMVISAPFGATGYFEDNSNTDTITTTSLINFRSTGRFGSSTMTLATVLFDDDESTYIRHAAINFHDLYNSPTEYYSLACNASTQHVVENNSKSRIGTTGTFSKMRLYLSVNSRGGVVARLRINNGNGNLVISTTTTTTGEFTDNSNIDDVVQGDEVNFSIDGGATAGGSNNIVCDILSVGWTNNDGRFHILSGINLGGIHPTTVPKYLALGGSANSNGATSETTVKADLNIAAKLSKLFANINIAGAAGQVMVRKNGVDTALFINVGASDTGVLANTTQSIEPVATDDMSIDITSKGNMQVWGMLASYLEGSGTVYIKGGDIKGGTVK